MDKDHSIGRESVADQFVTLLEAFEVEFLALVYQRIDNVDLPAECELSSYRTIDLLPLVVIAEQCGHRFAARRQLVDYRDVKVAINRHGKCAGYRSGGHYKYVRGDNIFLPQTSALHHTEAMLFVDNSHAEVSKSHLVFYHSVSTYENME